MIALEPNSPPKQASRYIVEILNDIDPALAFALVHSVLELGCISTTAGKPHHCHLTTFENGIRIACILNRKSERFVVYKE